MRDLGKREPAVRQSFDPRPGHPTPLARAPERTKPAADHLEPKTSQTDQIPGNCVIVEVALHNRPQPFPEIGQWQMPASSKFLLELSQLGGESLSDGLAQDNPVKIGKGRYYLGD